MALSTRVEEAGVEIVGQRPDGGKVPLSSGAAKQGLWLRSMRCCCCVIGVLEDEIAMRCVEEKVYAGWEKLQKCAALRPWALGRTWRGRWHEKLSKLKVTRNVWVS